MDRFPPSLAQTLLRPPACVEGGFGETWERVFVRADNKRDEGGYVD
jgi:hypothetical protein